jgi:transcription initiation factor TFIIIB Brf1 subunit/transcription initiation factor TFIIB
MLTFHSTILTHLFAYKLTANTKQHQQKKEKTRNSNAMSTLIHQTHIQTELEQEQKKKRKEDNISKAVVENIKSKRQKEKRKLLFVSTYCISLTK